MDTSDADISSFFSSLACARNLLRTLIAVSAAVVLSGCAEDTVAPETRARMPQDQASMAAMYGVNAQISYPGDVNSLAESATVYVFLRKPGTRMPLAVQHFPASQLPRSISFTSAAPEQNIELVARLSLSGKVDRAPEDIEVSRVVSEYSHPPQSHNIVLIASSSPHVRPSSQATAGSSDGAGRLTAVDSQSVSIQASVAIEASHQFPADTVVFVIARRPGQAMPTVVKRLSVADLPARVELTDADAMTFSNRLSGAERLDLLARVSTSGNAALSDADWVSDTLHLEIDKLPQLATLTIERQAGQ